MTRNLDKLQIYKALQQIEQLLESSPRAKFAVGNKRIVDLDALYDLLGDLKVSIPDDVRRANSVLTEVDTIISEADERAHNIIQSAERRASMTIDKATARSEQMLEEATTIFEQKIAEHPVYIEAQKRAQLVLRKAEYTSNVVFEDAKRYSDQVLADLLSYLSTYQTEITSHRARLNVREQNTRVENISEETSDAEAYQTNNMEEASDEYDANDTKDKKPSFLENMKNAISNLLYSDEEAEEEIEA